MARFLTSCDNPKCNKQFLRIRNQYLKFHNHYCSRSCAVSVNNTKFPKRTAKITPCFVCGKSFRGNSKFCSRKCKEINQSVSRDEILTWVSDFYQKMGRIPFKQECPHEKPARRVFGSWNKTLETAGLSTNPVMFAKKYVAKDGHKCDSLAEKIIDDWLSSKNIPHKVHVRYAGTKFTSDFLVGETFVEFFGLKGQLRKYDRLANEKLDYIKQHKIKLLPIYPQDLFPNSKLSAILSKVC